MLPALQNVGVGAENQDRAGVDSGAGQGALFRRGRVGVFDAGVQRDDDNIGL